MVKFHQNLSFKLSLVPTKMENESRRNQQVIYLITVESDIQEMSRSCHS